MFTKLNTLSEGLTLKGYTSMDGTQLSKFLFNFLILFSLFTIEFLGLNSGEITTNFILFAFSICLVIIPTLLKEQNKIFLAVALLTTTLSKDYEIWTIVFAMLLVLYKLTKIILDGITNAFLAMFSLGVSLVLFSATCVVQFETVKESNIHGPWDAIWWSICTITTVGYGDKFPVTDGGRIIALILMISGIGLFGTLIGYISSYFTDKEKKNNTSIDTIEELSNQIHELTKKIENK